MTTVPPGGRPRVSVVIPYYDGQRLLDLVLIGLEHQPAPMAGSFEVIVADDGSAVAPVIGARPFPVRVVTHADLGNRAGSARNAGAGVARGDVLVFIDGDTVPAPGFLAAMVQACDGQHLTVGRRRHADLSGWDSGGVGAWLRGDGPPPPALPEPQWLADGYAQTDDLRQADARSYRFIISALLACPRETFLRLGGFAEEVVGYGGEDWEFARRAWLGGVDLRYARDAVGWHDGPDLAGRPDDVRPLKNAETFRVAQLITDPALRGRGLWWDHPRIVVRCAGGGDAAAWVACAEGLLRAGDVGIWTGDGPAWPVTDPRIHRGLPPTAVTSRAELIVDLAAPVEAGPATLEAWQSAAPVFGGALLSAASPRDRARGIAPRRIREPTLIDDDVQLEARFARDPEVGSLPSS